MEGPLEITLSYCTSISWSAEKCCIHLATRGPYRARAASSAAIGARAGERMGAVGRQGDATGARHANVVNSRRQQTSEEHAAQRDANAGLPSPSLPPHPGPARCRGRCACRSPPSIRPCMSKYSAHHEAPSTRVAGRHAPPWQHAKLVQDPRFSAGSPMQQPSASLPPKLTCGCGTGCAGAWPGPGRWGPAC